MKEKRGQTMELNQTSILESQLVKIDECLMNLIGIIKKTKNNHDRLYLQMKANYLNEIMNYNEEVLLETEVVSHDQYEIDYDELISIYEYEICLIHDEKYMKQHISAILSSQSCYIDTLDMKEAKLEKEFINFHNTYACEFLDANPIKNYTEYQGERALLDLQASSKAYLVKDEELENLLKNGKLTGINQAVVILTHLNGQLLKVLGN